MSHVQKRTIEGVLKVGGAAPRRAISIPLLPKDGAWSITGQVIAVDEATPRLAVTFYPQFTGTCAGGVATPNSGAKVAGQPKERAKTWEPVGVSMVASGQQVEIEVTGIEDKTIVWAWSLDVVAVSLG